jgi:light-harvesting complex 1 beta chain
MNTLTHDNADYEVTAAPPGDGANFTSIFVVSFVVFLLIAVFAQAVALPWRTWLPGAEGSKSLVGGVRSSVYTFMSYLN